MSSDAALIEEIVGRVLKQLGTAAVAARPATAAPTPVSVAVPDVSITAHVVTGEILEGLEGSVRTIRVGPKAILTPSACDWIRQRGLTVSRETKVATKAAGSRWIVIVSHSTPQVTGAVEALRSSGMMVESRLSGSAQESAGQATAALCRGEAPGIVVLADQPELVACLANRNERIRAAVVHNVQSFDRVRTRFQPNLLAIDPVHQSLFELRQLLKSIITS